MSAGSLWDAWGKPWPAATLRSPTAQWLILQGDKHHRPNSDLNPILPSQIPGFTVLYEENVYCFRDVYWDKKWNPTIYIWAHENVHMCQLASLPLFSKFRLVSELRPKCFPLIILNCSVFNGGLGVLCTDISLLSKGKCLKSWKGMVTLLW